MKRLAFGLKLFFATLPMIIYIVWFIKYEPYNYFGLHDEARSVAEPLTLVREFVRNPSGNIILGDSRMNHVDLELAEELTGKKWCLLATGGQGAGMTYDLYEWAKTKADIQNVIVDISFYQLTSGKVSADIAPLVHIAEHPLEYVVTRDYVMETFSLWRAMQQGGTVSISREEKKEQENTSKYREDLVEYALNNIYPSCIDYAVDEKQKDYLIGVIKDVWEGGVLPEY